MYSMPTNKHPSDYGRFESALKPNTSTPFPMLRMSSDLLQLETSRHQNFVFSPCSIQLALSLLAHGATGLTLDQLLTFLQLDTLDQLTSVASILVHTLTQPQLDDSQRVPNPTSVGGAWTDRSLPLPDDSQRGHKLTSAGGAWNDSFLPLTDSLQRRHTLTSVGGDWTDHSLQRGQRRTASYLHLPDYSQRGHKRPWPDHSLPLPDYTQRGHKRAWPDHSLPLPDYTHRGHKRAWPDHSLPLPDYSKRGHKRAWPDHSLPLPDYPQRGKRLTSIRGAWTDSSLPLHDYSQRGRKHTSFHGDWNDHSLPLPDDSQKGSKLSFIGGAWIDHSLPLSPSFISCAENIYKVKAESVNFEDQMKAQEVVNKVNKWAEESTGGLIKSILTSLSPATRLVLANALYFKGTWEEPFSKSLTKDSDFYLRNGETVQVPFMSKRGGQFIRTFDDVKVLRLPYNTVYGKEAAFSMYIILPHQRDGLWSLVDKVGSNPHFLEKYTTNNTKQVLVGKFMVPKFKMTCEFEASQFLKGVGLRSCFTMEAEFHNMLLNPKLVEGPLYVSEVHHKSCIEIDEKGTEAAAATVFHVDVGCARFMPPPTVVDFVADHPFMFMIKDDHSGMVLFLGHVINPLLI